MVRAALAVCVPLSVGFVIGRRDIGLVPAVGGLIATVVDAAGPYVVRVKRMVTAAVFGGVAGLLIGMLIHHRGWVAVACLVVVALDEVADATTATGVAIRRGAPAPSPDAVRQLAAALYAVADAIDADVPPRIGELPGDEALKPVTDTVRPVLSALGSGPQPARPARPPR
jgi:hypothetical protein